MKINPAVSAYMAEIGAKGGKANSRASQSARAKKAWANMTKAQRSAELKKRAKVRAAKAARKKKP